jgi:hypothetical protein
MSRSWSREMTLNPGTFGGSPACHILVDMLNANVVKTFDKHRILRFINNSTWYFKCLSAISDSGVKMHAMTLMRDEFYSKIDLWTYPEKVKSLTKNVVNHHYRRYLKEVAQAIAP